MKTDFFIRRIAFVLLSTLCVPLTLFNSGFSQSRARTDIKIPDIPGYITLKCDFHTHTVFSDGSVWPTIRAAEAWREGLDAFSITDHIEYQPHKQDIPADHNRPYDIALSTAKDLDLLFMKGAEITRGMPPGHLNCIFLQDVNPLDTENVNDAIKAAINQEAFVFWNHPGWRQPEGKSIWYDEHTELYEKGWMHGIEVVNGDTYYPEAHLWCLEKGLTMMASSDIHNPMNLEVDFANGEHRPMTLVFASDRTNASLKDALFKGRTAVYWQNKIIGKEEYLLPLFHNSVQINNSSKSVNENESVNIQIKNNSEVSFELVANGDVEGLSFPDNVTLHAGKTVLLRIKNTSNKHSGKKMVKLPYIVKNMWILPEKGLNVDLKISLNVE